MLTRARPAAPLVSSPIARCSGGGDAAERTTDMLPRHENAGRPVVVAAANRVWIVAAEARTAPERLGGQDRCRHRAGSDDAAVGPEPGERTHSAGAGRGAARALRRASRWHL